MPAVNKTYTLGFKSSEGVEYDINISDDWSTVVVADGEGDHSLTANDFKLTYKSGSDDVLDPIKSSYLKFPVVITDSADEAVIEDIFTTNFDVNWYVRVFKKISGGSSEFMWWGYLSPLTAKRPNEYFPFDYSLEAQDTLALLKGQKIWSKIYQAPLSLPSLGINIPAPKHRFGSPRDAAVTLTTVWPKEKPTVIECIYSLLYDLDTTVDGNLNEITYWVPDTTLPGVGPLYATHVKIWNYLFNDVPPKAKNFNISIDPDKNADAYEILKSICELFCLRIFQKDGEYYVVQPEVYQSAASATVYKYTKNTLSNGPNPVLNGQDTLNTTDYLTAIPNDNSGPTVLSDSFWDKLKGLHSVSLTGQHTGGVWDWKQKRSISGTTNNLSDLSSNESDQVTEFPLGGITAISTPTNQNWRRGSATVSNDTYITNVDTRLELRNQFRLIFDGTLFTDNYSFLMGVTYFGDTFIPHEATLYANEDHWKCKWIEMRIESGGLGENIGELLNQDDLDAAMNQVIKNFWLLYWLNTR